MADLDGGWQDGVELLEEAQGPRVVAQPLAHDAKVIDGLGAVRLRTHALLAHGARQG